jgi:hypothetical protein
VASLATGLLLSIDQARESGSDFSTWANNAIGPERKSSAAGFGCPQAESEES